MPDVDYVADGAGPDEFVRLAMGTDPLQRPVDHERLALRHRGDHGVGFFEGRGERLLNHEMHLVRRDLPHPLAVLRRGGAKDHDVRLRLLEAGAIIGEAPLARDAEFAKGLLHPLGLFVADAYDLGLRMLDGHPQEVAHVKVIEIDARNSPMFGFHNHEFRRSLSGSENRTPVAKAPEADCGGGPRRAATRPPTGETFSLSQRERVGVRERCGLIQALWKVPKLHPHPDLSLSICLATVSEYAMLWWRLSRWDNPAAFSGGTIGAR